MPLRKLWNSFRGQTSASESRTDSGASSGVDSSKPSPKPNAPTKIGRVAASRDDKKLFKQLNSLPLHSILEVTVGDGQRSLAMLQKLTHKGHSTPIHYIAIDEFELGDGPLTLRQFHTQLRELPAKAHLVPMGIDAGLDRVVRTFGQVDLILWSAGNAPDAAQLEALARLSKPTTKLFARVDGQWTESRPGKAAGRAAGRAADRRAA